MYYVNVVSEFQDKTTNLYIVYRIYLIKVSVKENEVSTEKNSSRASIFATKASYMSN